jgi:ribosome-associated translation inhibitor RaiA
MPHSNDVKEYLEKRISKVAKLLKEPIKVHATINHEKYRYELSLKVSSQWFNFNVSQSGDDWRSVIDNASSSVENVARKERERLKERKKTQKLFVNTQPDFSASGSGNTFFTKVKEKIVTLKPISKEEALEELKNNSSNFIVYLDNVSNEVRVIYKKSQNVAEIIIPELA